MLVLSEFLLRIVYNEPLASLVRHSTDTWGSWFNEENVRISKTLGYEIVPNTRHYNSLGMPDAERTIKKTADVSRIICVGDSVTARSQFPQFLEQLLNEEQSLCYEVWNAGIVGYSLKQECLYIEEKLLVAEPDLVLIGFCWNDFDTTPLVARVNDQLVGVFPSEEKLGLNPFLLRHSALYRLGVKGLFALQRKKIGKQEGIVDETREQLLRTQTILTERGIPVVLVLLPMPVSLEENLGWYAFRQLIVIAEGCGIPYIDLRESVKGRTPGSMRIDADDASHLNQDMGQVIAHKIKTYLTDHNYI